MKCLPTIRKIFLSLKIMNGLVGKGFSVSNENDLIVGQCLFIGLKAFFFLNVCLVDHERKSKRYTTEGY
jgi:hypothetical protein